MANFLVMDFFYNFNAVISGAGTRSSFETYGVPRPLQHIVRPHLPRGRHLPATHIVMSMSVALYGRSRS